MGRQEFRQVVHGTTSSLTRLSEAYADGLLDGLGPFAQRRFARYRLIGMGTSHIASSVAASRMRSLGLDAAADLASSRHGWPMHPDTLVVAVSASGRTTEVLAALDRLDGHFPVLAITDDNASPVADRAGVVLPLHAGAAEGDLGIRAYLHTGLVLQSLIVVWTGGLPTMVARDQTHLIDKVATARTELADRRGDWLGATAETLSAPGGTAVLAPAERLGSALHGARVLRRGPARSAWGVETADWWHTGPVTRTESPMAALLFTGSRYDPDAVRRLAEVGSPLVAVGAAAGAASELLPAGRHAIVVRHRYDEESRVAQFAESAVAELLAAELTWPT